MVEVAHERDNINQKTIAEIEVLNNMRNKGDLAVIDMQKYKKEVERFMNRMRYKDIKKKIKLDPKKPSPSDITINDLNDKVELIFRSIANLEVQIKDYVKVIPVPIPDRPRLPPIVKRNPKSPSNLLSQSLNSSIAKSFTGEDTNTSLL